ncbi:hypothetical protein OXX69_004955 [Metschnikowia pulcherrima]
MRERRTIVLLACLAGVFSITMYRSSSQISVIEHNENNNRINLKNDKKNADDNDDYDHVQFSQTMRNKSPVYSEIMSSLTVDMTNQTHFASNNTQIAEACLKRFAAHLRSYINERYFDFACFEKGIDKLENELTHVSTFVMHMKPRDRVILKRLVFESQKLVEMQQSSELLKKYNFLGLVDHELVSRMVELNVRLISLKTMDDKLDSSVKNYSRRLFDAWRDMCLYEERFERLVNISAFTTADFRFQLDQAIVTIEDLWSQVPEGEYNVNDY